MLDRFKGWSRFGCRFSTSMTWSPPESRSPLQDRCECFWRPIIRLLPWFEKHFDRSSTVLAHEPWHGRRTNTAKTLGSAILAAPRRSKSHSQRIGRPAHCPRAVRFRLTRTRSMLSISENRPICSSCECVLVGSTLPCLSLADQVL